MQKTDRIKKHHRIRKTVIGTKGRPRLSVFRSAKHIYAQIIDDSEGKTFIGLSDIKQKGTKKEKAYGLGKTLAEKAKAKKITTVVFDRGGFQYQGRIARLAEGARVGGLKF